MEWFKTVAPIRTKLLVAFGSLASLPMFICLIGLIMGNMPMAVAGLVAGLVAVPLAAFYRRHVADPYVTTTVFPVSTYVTKLML